MDKNLLSNDALNALREAEDRRDKKQSHELPKEYGGPKGLEPTRYGDWVSKKGLISDF